MGSVIIDGIVNIILIAVPVIIAVYLAMFAWRQYVAYVRNKWLDNSDFTLFQLVLPENIEKTPAAMELFLGTLHQTGGEGSFKMKYMQGMTRAQFSLEIVGIDGDVFFFLRTSDFFKDYVKSQIYAQWPDIEILEVEDYSKAISNEDHTAQGLKMWAADFTLVAPDPFPIKTYVDYGLDKEGVEETQKIDPITPMLEYLAALRKGEQVWIQIITRAHKKEDKKVGTWFGKTDNWVDEAKAEVEKIREAATPIDDEGRKGFMNLTKGDDLKIAALERSVSKLGFDIGIRGIYLAEKDLFTPSNIAGLVGSFKQYGSDGLNGFKPKNSTGFDYKWQDPFGNKSNKLKNEYLRAYQDRGFFYAPYDRNGLRKPRNKFILNTEELATIFHFPGKVAETSSFARVSSRRSQPPANLPT